jgi:hypothetical protein
MRNGVFHAENPHCWSILPLDGSPGSLPPAAGPVHAGGASKAVPASAELPQIRELLREADVFAPPERSLVVLPDKRSRNALEMVRDLRCGSLILHPEPDGTASSVFRGLAHVIARDQEATVVIRPLANQSPADPSLLNKAAADAVGIVDRLPKKAVLLATSPGEIPRDTGNRFWIDRGQKYRKSLSGNLWTVKRLIDEPDPGKAAALAARGSLQFTSVVVAKAKLVWRLGLWCVPEILIPFAWVSEHLAWPTGGEFAQSTLKKEPSYCWIRNLIMRACRHLAVLEIAPPPRRGGNGA